MLSKCKFYQLKESVILNSSETLRNEISFNCYNASAGTIMYKMKLFSIDFKVLVLHKFQYVYDSDVYFPSFIKSEFKEI